MDTNKKFVGVSIDDHHVRLELEGKCKEQAKQLEDKQKEIDRIEGFLFGYKTLQRPFKYVIDLEEKCKELAKQLKIREKEVHDLREQVHRFAVRVDTLEAGCDDTKEYLCSANCDPCPFDSDKAARDGFPNCYVENLKKELNIVKADLHGLQDFDAGHVRELKKRRSEIDEKECVIQDLCQIARCGRDELKRTASHMADRLSRSDCMTSSICTLCPLEVVDGVGEGEVPHCYKSPRDSIKDLKEEVGELKDQVEFQIEVREKVEEQLKEVSERLLDAEEEKDDAVSLLKELTKRPSGRVKTTIKEGNKVDYLLSRASDNAQRVTKTKIDENGPLTKEEETGDRHAEDCC